MSKGRRCQRCAGLTYMYKVGAGYTRTDMGGAKVDCPLCNGTGVVPSLEECKEIIAGDEQRKLDEKSSVKTVQKDASCKPKNVSTKKVRSEI